VNGTEFGSSSITCSDGSSVASWVSFFSSCDPLQYSLHSLQAGGATSATPVPSVSREELKRHGRWATSAVDRPVRY